MTGWDADLYPEGCPSQDGHLGQAFSRTDGVIASGAGVRYLSELWGRSVVYSRLHRSASICPFFLDRPDSQFFFASFQGSGVPEYRIF